MVCAVPEGVCMGKKGIMAGLSRSERRKAFWVAMAVVLVMLLAAALVITLLMNRQDAAHLPAPRASESLVADSTGMDDITVDAVFNPDDMTLTATQTMRLENRTGQDQSAVVLRSYSGAYLQQETSPAASEELFLPSYGDMFVSGGLTLSGVQLGGEWVLYSWLDDACTVLSVPAKWDAGSAVTVTLKYTVDIPECASRFGHYDGMVTLGNVFPTPAAWLRGEWHTGEYVPVGDPFVSPCVNWQVRLRTPSNWAAAASAPGETRQEADTTVHEFTGYAMRDFALVLYRDVQTAARMAGDTLLKCYVRDGQDAAAVLDTAQRALETYERRFGEYRYPVLTLAEVHFSFSGMEYPGLVMISDRLIAQGGENLEYAVAHEVAHQWWGIQVGSDGWRQAWQDESLCEYALLCYLEDVHGQSVREEVAFTRIETALRITYQPGLTPGAPLDYFPSLSTYTQAVYRRGAALWTALETYMGKESLEAALREYQQQYCFSLAIREDLIAILSRHAGADVTPLVVDYIDTELN